MRAKFAAILESMGTEDAWRGRMVAVIHTERGQNVRVISARLATRHER